MQVQVFIMSCCSKENMERNDYNNTCKSHSAKSDRDANMYRICPSKLSKRELEDLYFTLLENNLELKKTINGQHDKIRVLSTQVQRMTNAHEKMMSKEMKECSTSTKAFVNEQKDFITELKETNQRMAERIQQLNMRLCSAKQFSKTTPLQTSTAKRFRSPTSSPPKKHNCVTKDQDGEQVHRLSASTQWEDRAPTRSTQTQFIVPLEKDLPKSDQLCDENKCRSLMEELKIKIVTLQEELSNVHDEYSTRIGRLESEVSEVRKENIRVSSERTASEHELQSTVKRTSDILAQYRLSEAKCSELTTELAIEKRKVAELETQLKAANMSDKVNKTIESHLTTIQEISGEPDDSVLKCHCGCPPPHRLPCVMDGKEPIKTLPPLSSPTKNDPEDLTTKTDLNSSKVSSSTSQEFSKSSPTKTLSEDTNCETCGCKSQLTSDVVPVPSPMPDDELNCETCGCKSQLKSALHKPTAEELNCETCDCKSQLKSDPLHKPTAEELNCETCGCKSQLKSALHKPTAEDFKSPGRAPSPQDPSTHTKDIQCDLCGCPPPTNTSTPLKVKNKSVECCCPTWVKSGILKPPSSQIQGINAKCATCCFKYEQGATESLPAKNGKLLSPRGATTRWSPSKERDSTKSSKTSDDSGYQDTDEQVLQKQNRELLKKILELQSQVDDMKILISEMSEAKPAKISESTESPKKTEDYAVVNTVAAPLLGALKKASETQETVLVRFSSADNTTAMSNRPRPWRRDFAQVRIPGEEIKYKSMEGGYYESRKEVPLTQMVSDESVREPGKILSIEILGDPKDTVLIQDGDHTRAKTIEDADGTIHITEDTSSDNISPLDLMRDDFRERLMSDAHKLKIVEKKKLEIPGSIKHEVGNVSLKLPTSEPSVGPGFNPEKLKYLEAEGMIAIQELGQALSNFTQGSVSFSENIPSNPELGFVIPRLVSSQDRYKAESDSVQAKKALAAGSPGPDMEGLHGKLKLPMTEALVANTSTAPNGEEKKAEDCENCIACSFDKECELRHEIATNTKIDELAPGMQKEQAKKHDQHGGLQIPDPVSSDSKREKMRNLFSNILKDKSKKEKKEGFTINPTISEQQIIVATDRPVHLPDVPMLSAGQIDTDSINIEKKTTFDKRESLKSRKVIETNEEFNVQNTSMADLPLPDKRKDCKDSIERKPSRIVFSINDNLDPPLLEVKMPSYRPHSDRMLPTLQGSTDRRGKPVHVERTAQSTDPKLAQKSSQAPTNTESGRVSLYRRRSGSLRTRAAAGPAPCRCAAQHAGYCSDKPRGTGIQAHDKEKVKSPREQRQALLTSERGTYTVNSKRTDTSPDNTDLEMSNLSDLPLEKEKKSPIKSRSLSPGENRTTTFTNTDSFYSPPETSSLLSEGEMPVTTRKLLKRSDPDIERPYLNATLAHKLETPPSQQMEAALHAISEELKRCKSILHRPIEVNRRAAPIL